jgi:hypothetical protein
LGEKRSSLARTGVSEVLPFWQANKLGWYRDEDILRLLDRRDRARRKERFE